MSWFWNVEVIKVLVLNPTDSEDFYKRRLLSLERRIENYFSNSDKT